MDYLSVLDELMAANCSEGRKRSGKHKGLRKNLNDSDVSLVQENILARTRVSWIELTLTKKQIFKPEFYKLSSSQMLEFYLM